MDHIEPGLTNDPVAVLREAQLAALLHHLIGQAEKEKAALARQLHDELGACLTVMALDISIVAEKLKQSDPELTARLQRALGKVKDAVALKRQWIDGLRPGMLDNLGLFACLSEYALAFEKRTRLPVTLDLCQDFDNLDAVRAIAIFRIAEEALRNAEKHAGASRLWLSLQAKDGGAQLLVEDDGAGIDPSLVQKPESVGLAGMREHMALHGGSLQVRRRDQGKGTAVEAWLSVA